MRPKTFVISGCRENRIKTILDFKLFDIDTHDSVNKPACMVVHNL